MKISVRAYGLLQEAIKDKKWVTLDLEQGATVIELLDKLGLQRDSVMNVVNQGKICAWDYVIQEDDKLELIPIISAG
jgi:molybdopterin converting factor small subunit